MLPDLPTAPRARAAALGLLLLLLVPGCASSGDQAGTTTAIPSQPSTTAAAPGAIWPGTRAAQLDLLHGQANRGQRKELLDPVAVTRAYVTTALPSEAQAAGRAPGLVLTRFTATSPRTGEVAIRGPRLAPSTVSLRRYDSPDQGPAASGERPIWYVRGLGSTDLDVLDVDYDGTRLTGSLVPGRSGRVVVRTSTLDGKTLATRTTAAQKGRLVDLGVAAPDQPGLVVTAVLTADGITSLRVFRIGAPAAR
jgi:hypothetical protein